MGDIAAQSSGFNFKILLVKPKVILMQLWAVRITTGSSISKHQPSFQHADQVSARLLSASRPIMHYVTALATLGNCAWFPRRQQTAAKKELHTLFGHLFQAQNLFIIHGHLTKEVSEYSSVFIREGRTQLYFRAECKCPRREAAPLKAKGPLKLTVLKSYS